MVRLLVVDLCLFFHFHGQLPQVPVQMKVRVGDMAVHSEGFFITVSPKPWLATAWPPCCVRPFLARPDLQWRTAD